MMTETELDDILRTAADDRDVSVWWVMKILDLRREISRMRAVVDAARAMLNDRPHDVTTESTNLYAALRALDGGHDDKR